MSIQGNALFFGSFTSTGEARTLEFGTSVSAYFQLNETQFNSIATPSVLKRAWFISGMASASYMGVQNTAGAATDESIRGFADGFRPFRSDQVQLFASVAVTGITQAASAVVTAPLHGVITGDTVRLIDITNMQQLSGIVFTVTVTSANTFTIPVDTSPFALAGGAGSLTQVVLSPWQLQTKEMLWFANPDS